MATAAGKGKRKKAVKKTVKRAKAKPARKLRAVKGAKKPKASNRKSVKKKATKKVGLGKAVRKKAGKKARKKVVARGDGVDAGSGRTQGSPPQDDAPAGRRRHRVRDLSIGELKSKAKLDPNTLTVREAEQLTKLAKMSAGKKGGVGECVSINRAAELLGRSRRTVENLRDAGKLDMVGTGRVTVESICLYLRDARDAAVDASGAVAPKKNTLQWYKMVLTRLRGENLQLRNDKETSKLVDRNTVKDHLVTVGLRVKAGLTAVGRKHGKAVADDIADCIGIVQKYFGIS